MTRSDRRRYFFIHVMKTGGTTFDGYIMRNVALQNQYGRDKFAGALMRQREYVNVHRLLLTVRHRQPRPTFLRGHFPFAATELVGDPGITLTILRHPVERTISFLRHAQKYHPEHRGLPFEKIYDDAWWYPRFVENYQVKLFGMTAAQAAAPRPRPAPGMSAPDVRSSRALYEFFGPHPIELVAADDELFARALKNIGAVDVVGFTDRYLDFLVELRDRFGWFVDTVKERNRGDHATNVEPALRRRIERDQALDIEFYESARAMRVMA